MLNAEAEAVADSGATLAKPRDGAAILQRPQKKARPQPAGVQEAAQISLVEHEAAMEEKILQLQHQHHQEVQQILQQQSDLRARLSSSHLSRSEQLQHEAEAHTAAALDELAQTQAQEKAVMREQHAAALKEADKAIQRRVANGKQFAYAVRGSSEPHLQGSVPHSVFDAEPDSILAQMYNGDWEYPKDEQGRAFVNSNPANWLLILDWLSFGTVPANPSAELIQQCRFWHLTNLLAVIDAPTPPGLTATPEEIDPMADIFTISKPDDYDLTIRCDSKDCQARFTAEGYVHKWHQRYARDAGRSSISFSVFGHPWRLGFGSSRVFLGTDQPLAGSMDTFSVLLTAGKHASKPLVSLNVCSANSLRDVIDVDLEDDYWAGPLHAELFRAPFVDARGRFYMSLAVTYS